MGLLSFLFKTDHQAEIEACKERIINFERIIETVKKNNQNKKEAHYKKSAAENIKTLNYQIKKEKEKIATLKVKIK